MRTKDQFIVMVCVFVGMVSLGLCVLNGFNAVAAWEKAQRQSLSDAHFWLLVLGPVLGAFVSWVWFGVLMGRHEQIADLEAENRMLTAEVQHCRTRHAEKS